MEKTLLLVDDEENVIRSLRRLFRPEAFSVVSANSGMEGLQILESQPIAVILSDQRMPGMIGSEFLKIVKERYPDTVRIVMSGYTELESVTSAINDGAIFKFLLKPWDDEKLLMHIRDAFMLHNLKESNAHLTEELKKVNASLEEKVREEQKRGILHAHSLLLSQELLSRIPVAVFGISDAGLIVMANEFARRLIGQDAIVGNIIDDVMPNAICNVLYAALANSGDSSLVDLNWPNTGQKVKIIEIPNPSIHCLCVCIV